MNGSIVLARRVHLAATWVFLAAILLQVFLIGLVLFAGGNIDNHRQFGYSIIFVALAVLLTALWARVPRRDGWMAAAVLGLYIVQTSFPQFKASAPAVAALHPVFAILLFWLGLVVARRARELYQSALAQRSGSTVVEPATTEAR
jgi:Family of unknown function (DUF6220)